MGKRHKGRNKGRETNRSRKRLNSEKKIYSHYERQPVYSIQNVIDLNRRYPFCYEVSIDVGQKEHFSSGVSNFLMQAKTIALEKACGKLVAAKWPAQILELKKTKTIVDNLSVHEWAKSMNNETIGLLFKDILSHFQIQEKIHLKYITHHHREGELVGYTSEVEVNGEKFKSSGLMTNEDQAEQSAAEICLRTLGYLPEVASEGDLIIQPFRGGYICKDVDYKKPYISTSKLNSDVLEAFIASRSLMEAPKYYIKYHESKSTQDGKEKMTNCICCVDGKVFEASPLQPESIAIQVAAEKAVNHFGLSNIHQSMEFRKHLPLFKTDFYMRERLHDRKPSENKNWLWSCFARENTYQECKLPKTVQDLLESSFFQSNLLSVDAGKKLITSKVMEKPSFKGKLLVNHDISVAAIDATNPNLVTIGNSDFSIKMWCTDGKIYSKQRKCVVEILPGHNIHQLSCEYRVLLPSLEVYLHAVCCVDLFYPNPPKPVVTACGVVVLFHDYSASPNDIYVLLQQKIDYKPIKSKFSNVSVLKKLLHKLIQPILEIEVTPAKAMEGIDQWNEDDVKLLSEMSMESLCKMLSKYGKYDTRWNELFAKHELPEELKEIQDICLKELKRLEEEKEEKTTPCEDKVDKSLEWELPQSEFMSHFDDTGIFIEGSEFCGMRSLAETTGTKISLGDIEKSSVIDIPIENDGKQHRGDILRYYMWNKIEKDSVPKLDDDETELLKDYTLYKKHIIRHNGIRYLTQNKYSKWKRMKNCLRNVQYINLDGSKVSCRADPSKEHHIESKNSEESMEVDSEMVDEIRNEEESLEDDIKVCDETNNGEESEDSDIEVSDIEPSDNTDEIKDEEESKEDEVQVSVSLHDSIDPYSITTDMVENKDSVDDGEDTLDEYIHVDEDDIGVTTENGNITEQKAGNASHQEGSAKGKRKARQIRGKYNRDRRYLTGPKFPPRDAFTLQCEWMILDKALGECPMLKKVAETTTFQDQLNWFVSELSKK